MTYRIEFTKAAARQMRKLPTSAGRRLLAKIESLQDDPRPPGARKLVGEDGAWRVRVGDYRVIYEILDRNLVVTIVAAGHRREIYAK